MNKNTNFNTNFKLGNFIISMAFLFVVIFLSFSIANAAVIDNGNQSVSVDGSSTINDGLNSLNSIYSGNGTIYLNENNYNGNGNVNITLNNRNVTIVGNRSTVIDGSNLNWIFNVSGGQLTLINLTFANAYSNSSGSVINSNSHLEIINCTFSNNTANTSNNNLNGGAIYYSGDYFLINNSKFEFNQASRGGAIFVDGNNVLVINSNFTNNTGFGGAINLGFNSGNVNNITINNSAFINNSKSNSGGVIYNYNGTNVSIYNSVFLNNNASTFGGAIFNSQYGNMLISNCKFNGNNVNTYGGAISNGGNIIIKNSEFSDNFALYWGGAIYNTGNITIEDSGFQNNYLISSGTTAGGAIFSEKTGFRVVVNILNSNFTNNNATLGGAIFARNNVTMNIINSNFANNNAINGSAISSRSNVAINITNSNFKDNNATIGTIYNDNGSTMFLSKNQMTGNTATLGTEIYNRGIISVLNLTYLSNSTVKVKNNTYVTVYATLTDDMGNTVTGGNISFYINGTLMGIVESIEGTGNISYLTGNSEGIIPVTGDYTGHGIEEIEIKNGEFLVLSGADLNGNISFDKKEYIVNETAKGTINIINNGTGTARNVTVTVNLPKDFVLNNDVIVSHGYFDSNTSIWYIGDLESDESATMTFTGRFTEKGSYIVSMLVNGTYLDGFEDSIDILVNEKQPTPTPTPTPINNDTNKTSNNSVAGNAAMKKTGMPIIAILLVLLSSLGLVIRKK